MRVIAGSVKGQRLKPVPGTSTRPVLDRVKTAVFDTIQPSIQNARFLDLFAGSGAIGIEALSRGAAYCLFNDLSPSAVQTIRENIESTKFIEKVQIRRTDAFSLIKKLESPYDFIYVAPPQYKSMWIEAMMMISERPELLTDNGVVLVQIDPKEYEELILTHLILEREKRMGNTLVLWYRKASSMQAMH